MYSLSQQCWRRKRGLDFRLRLQFPFYSVVYPLNTRPLCKSRQQRINVYALAIDLILDYWICFNNTMNQQVIVSVKNRDFFCPWSEQLVFF